MGTRATVSILNENGTVESVYCKSDGYLARTGEYLYMYYGKAEKIKQLISMGAMLILEKEIDIPEGVSHGYEYEDRAKDVTTFFQRDGHSKDSFSKMSIHDDLTTFFNNNDFQEFDYLFKVEDNTWYLINLENNNTLLPLKEQLIENPTKSNLIDFFIKSQQIEADYKNLKNKMDNFPVPDNSVKAKKIKI